MNFELERASGIAKDIFARWVEDNSGKHFYDNLFLKTVDEVTGGSISSSFLPDHYTISVTIRTSEGRFAANRIISIVSIAMSNYSEEEFVNNVLREFLSECDSKELDRNLKLQAEDQGAR